MSLCWSNITTKGSREKRSIFLLCVCMQQYTVQAIGADFFFSFCKNVTEMSFQEQFFLSWFQGFLQT